MLIDVESFLKSDDLPIGLVRQCMHSEEYCREALRELKCVIKDERSRKNSFHEMLREARDKIRELYKENNELRDRVFELQSKYIGLNVFKAYNMKRDYEHGTSLRELAKVYGCDKSTIKRRLIKMGVTIRGKGGD